MKMTHRIRILTKVISLNIAYTVFRNFLNTFVFKKDCLWKYCTFPSIWKGDTGDFENEPRQKVSKKCPKKGRKSECSLSFIYFILG